MRGCRGREIELVCISPEWASKGRKIKLVEVVSGLVEAVIVLVDNLRVTLSRWVC